MPRPSISLLITISSVVATDQLTCGDVRQLYTDSQCCPSSGGTPQTEIRPECAQTEFERKCSQIPAAGELVTSHGYILGSEYKTNQGNYCEVKGETSSGSPFIAQFPETAPKRLFHTGQGTHGRWFPDASPDGTWSIFAEGETVYSQASPNSVGYQPEPGGAKLRFGTLDDLASIAGKGHTQTRDVVQEVSKYLYGSSLQYTYIYGCSGNGRDALYGLMQDTTWDGAMISDPWEYTYLGALQVQAMQLHYTHPDIATDLYTRNNEFNIAFCDSDSHGDGISDGLAEWACPYKPTHYACNGADTAPGFDANRCFNDTEILLMRKVYGMINEDGTPNDEPCIRTTQNKKQQARLPCFAARMLPNQEKILLNKLDPYAFHLADAYHVTAPLHPDVQEMIMEGGFADNPGVFLDPDMYDKIWKTTRKFVDPICRHSPSYTRSDYKTKVMLFGNTGDHESTPEMILSTWKVLYDINPSIVKGYMRASSQVHCYQGVSKDLQFTAMVKWVEHNNDTLFEEYEEKYCALPNTRKEVNGTVQCVDSIISQDNTGPCASLQDVGLAGTWQGRFGYGYTCSSFIEEDKTYGVTGHCGTMTIQDQSDSWSNYGMTVEPPNSNFTSQSLIKDVCAYTCCQENLLNGGC